MIRITFFDTYGCGEFEEWVDDNLDSVKDWLRENSNINMDLVTIERVEEIDVYSLLKVIEKEKGGAVNK